MKVFALIAAWSIASLVAIPVAAQPIHRHPQKTAYASSAEWPTRDWQCHANPGNRTPEPTPPFPVIPIGIALLDPQVAHTHLACTFPDYAEIAAAFPVSCTIKLFHTAGTVSGVYSPLNQIRDIVYDDTGTSTPPVMRGDPTSMMPRQWNVRFVFDPTMVRPTFPPQTTTPHGWFGAQISVVTQYDNGDSQTLDHLRPFYSVLDPTAPETPMSDEGLPNGARCSPNNLRRPELSPFGNQMGTVVSEFVGLLPIAPIQTPWHTTGFFYGYASDGQSVFPFGTFELRHDLDVHNGNVGVLTATETFNGLIGLGKRTPITIDPADLGTGTHKVAALWQQPDGQGNNYTALAVLDVTVGPGIPPPTRCTDPLATNVGGPLPCVFPVVPVWTPVTAFFERFGSEERYRLCDALHLSCRELVFK